MSDHTPGELHWHDAFGRKDGQGEPLGIGRGVTGDEPQLGNCSRFSYAVSDEQGFIVAHCTGALVTMSSRRSEANARLFAAAPKLLDALNKSHSLIARLEAHLQQIDEWDDEWQDAIEANQSAIAKAEGRT